VHAAFMIPPLLPLSRLPASRAVLAALTLVSMTLIADASADEMTADKPKATGSRVAQVRAVHKRVRAEHADASGDAWFQDFVGRLLDPPAAAPAPRQPRMVRAPLAKPVENKMAALVATPMGHASATLAAPQSAVVVPSPSAPTSPIVTGALAVPAKPVIPLTLQGDDLIMTAERAQAAQDLVKLELALRSYEELRQSGQSAFETRPDWRVLERAQDALSGAELAAAQAVGFEANAYINEAQRTIVIGIAGTKDLRRHLIAADIWQALIKAEQPQHFYMAKSYVRSVITRYQLQGFHTECVGHSLGGGACAYVASELGIRALVVNPITAGKSAPGARFLVTNYVVDGDIAHLVYGARGNQLGGDIQWISDGRGAARAKVIEKYGSLAGPILVIKDLRNGIDSHKLTRALDLIAQQAGVQRIR
jgi:hypothetical protein